MDPLSHAAMEGSMLAYADFLHVDMLDGSNAFTYLTHPTDQPLPAQPESPTTSNHGEAPAHGSTTPLARETNQCEYEPVCPYHVGPSLGLPKFRLVDLVSGGQVYIGDSYGGGSFINIEEERPCSPDCRCRRPESEPNDFVFTAHKDSDSFELQLVFHDPSLCNQVAAATGLAPTPEPGKGARTPTTFDGLALLSKYEQLRQYLELHRSLNDGPSRAVLALSLLVDSFLAEGELFRTFGYENLYERGFLSFEHWKIFQRGQLADDITLLDDSLTAFAEAHTWSTPNGSTPVDRAMKQARHKSTVQLPLDRGGKSRSNRTNLFDLAMDRGWEDIALRLFRCSLTPKIPSQRHRPLFVHMIRASRREEETVLLQSQRNVTAYYRAFVQEFGRISNSDMPWVGYQFRTPQTAWRCGIRTLRDIKGGRLPQDLEEVMAFLCICKAASATLDLLTASEYTTRFFTDLPRWGILFGDLESYKDAVRRFWDYVWPDAWDVASCHTAEEGLSVYAQGLVTSLVGESNLLIRSTMTAPGGLAGSQRRWRERLGQTAPPPPNKSPESADPKPPDIAPEDRSPLQRRISNDFSTSIDGKLVILMTGAIFANMLVFLSLIRNQVVGNPEATMLVLPPPICGNPLCRGAVFLGSCRVLQNYLGLSLRVRSVTSSTHGIGAESQQAFDFNPAPTTGGDSFFGPSSQQGDSDDGENTADPMDVDSVRSQGQNWLSSVFSTRPATASPAGGGAVSDGLQCNVCRKTFSNNINLLRHKREQHEGGKKKYKCRRCNRGYGRKDYLEKRHKCGN